jgi:hypothetical protein
MARGSLVERFGALTGPQGQRARVRAPTVLVLEPGW